MTFQLTKDARKGGMLGIGHVLVTREQHLVLEQQGFDFARHVGIAASLSQIDALDLGTQSAGEWNDFHKWLLGGR